MGKETLAGVSRDTVHRTQLDRELYSIQPRLPSFSTNPLSTLFSLSLSLFSFLFSFFFSLFLRNSFIQRSRPSRECIREKALPRLLLLRLIQFISAPSPLRRPSSCFRPLHSTVKGKVCNEISSEPSPGDHYAIQTPRGRVEVPVNRPKPLVIAASSSV